MKAWCKYVRETVKHYKGRIAMWEIWNEPNLRSKNNPEYYAEMLIRTAEEIRKIDNEAVILAFGLSGMPLGWTKSVMDIVKERKKLHLINYVSYHPYYPNPDTATTDILALRKLVKSYSEKSIFSGRNRLSEHPRIRSCHESLGVERIQTGEVGFAPYGQ